MAENENQQYMQNLWDNDSFDIKNIPVKESELSATHLMFAIKGHNHHMFLRRILAFRQAIVGISIITS
jgi:hypothetical protein